MSQRIKSNKARKARGFTYLWILVLAVSVFLLIYFEQTSLLYILATLGVTILLVVVALADLGHSELTPGTVPAPDTQPPSTRSPS
jgi:hypothetical protein